MPIVEVRVVAGALAPPAVAGVEALVSAPEADVGGGLVELSGRQAAWGAELGFESAEERRVHALQVLGVRYCPVSEKRETVRPFKPVDRRVAIRVGGGPIHAFEHVELQLVANGIVDFSEDGAHVLLAS